MKSGKQRRQAIKAARAQRRRRECAQRDGGAVGRAPCNPVNLAPYNSYGTPAFVERGYYSDLPFRCIDCGTEEIWRATQQKWWYEVAKGSVESSANRCRACRRRERERRAEARRVHLEGLAQKQRLKASPAK